MSTNAQETADGQPVGYAARPRFYWGWINVVVAAVAMTATLPGRTHGLGLITTPLTQDPSLQLTERAFSDLNFWAIILGAAMCIPVGALIDRLGSRLVLTLVSLGLGLSVIGMSYTRSTPVLFVMLVLIRGLGQGALSVVSMALIGKWFTRKLGHAMGVFTVLIAFGFIISVLMVGEAVKNQGWRPAWGGLGWALALGMAPLGWLLTRSTPEAAGVEVEGLGAEAKPLIDLPLMAALKSPAFWVFTLGMGVFNMTWSAITLFNQSILDEHGLGGSFVTIMAVLVFTGLPANILAGWLLTRWSIGSVLAIGMGALALSLAVFPWVNTTNAAIGYTTGLGVSGGVVTVVFFAINGQAFGRESFGKIQAVSQVASVFASAIGPVLFTLYRARYGTSDPLFLIVAGLSALFAVACPFVKLPSREANA